MKTSFISLAFGAFLFFLPSVCNNAYADSGYVRKPHIIPKGRIDVRLNEEVSAWVENKSLYITSEENLSDATVILEDMNGNTIYFDVMDISSDSYTIIDFDDELNGSYILTVIADGVSYEVEIW